MSAHCLKHGVLFLVTLSSRVLVQRQPACRGLRDTFASQAFCDQKKGIEIQLIVVERPLTAA